MHPILQQLVNNNQVQVTPTEGGFGNNGFVNNGFSPNGFALLAVGYLLGRYMGPRQVPPQVWIVDGTVRKS
jgi:hypothetical protein